MSNLQLLSVALGVVLSALTALVTHEKAPAQVKAVLLLLFSAIGAVVLPATQSGQFDWRHVLTTLAVTFLTAVGAHFGLLKPVGLTGDGGTLSGVGLQFGAPAPDPAPPAADGGAPDPAP